MRCSQQEAAENFLDGFHTHFVHAGWIRHDTKRQRIIAQIRQLKDGVEAHYSEETKQSGFISRILEGERGVSMGRFRLPGLAEIEYRDRSGRLNLLVSAWLTPSSDGQLRVFARVATAQGWMPAAIKRAVLRRLFKIIFRQDRGILEKVSANHQRFQNVPPEWFRASPLDSPQDLLGPLIRQLLVDGQMRDFQEHAVELRL
ncbi:MULTISPECIES: hypothetical protein [unclassified Pseudomonas]|uniref:hypothetical protein n=2 Tax=Pseudomonas TaxID=286 RepID=UPI002AC8E870|nr:MULTISPECIES: hypothetical protein [unclassified Pseudomonas]MEB0079632.1 hypothetical protein [Pseudomonas sp. MH10out]MEB0133088.1 hypothetical protein [Pseudomonas sp. CCI2.4]MEB0169340.1 hypothetical protein [Pseudomonas sp. CCC4.4]WPX27944.1 hypothetical protein RHM64_24190 [Pseudomonas sp. AH2]